MTFRESEMETPKGCLPFGLCKAPLMLACRDMRVSGQDPVVGVQIYVCGHIIRMVQGLAQARPTVSEQSGHNPTFQTWC